MKFSVIPLVWMMLLGLFPLAGEEIINTEPPEESEVSGDEPVFFPIYALLSALDAPDIRWQPDWPVAMPPDAFVVENGRPRSITLTLDSASWRVTRNRDELFTDFPFLFQGNFIQVRRVLGASGNIQELIIEDTDRPWNIEFLDGDDPALLVMRITQGEEVFFGVVQNALTGDMETWYDRNGNPLAVCTYLFNRPGSGILTMQNQYTDGEIQIEQHQNSFGNISEINSPLGRFSAGYTKDGRPRYWERRLLRPMPADVEGEEPVLSEFHQSYAFQWNEGGFLVRLTGTPGPDETDPVDFRYDYTLDERGNWIERREIRMIPRFGILVPSPGARIIRTIEYGED
ncbi:hypothetical protein LQZ21_02305 [Treponema sp. TIM-1]|uniref:hypothetical protein n=1 Tax=Treponema sp. TIM-1 TaxID=2898417 RepID=UPI00397EEBD0